MPSTRLKIALLSVPVLLFAGCDGYVPQPYQGFPYNNIRTAGSGVEYVRANMAKPAGPVIQAAQPENKAVVMPPAPQGPPAPVQETKKILETIDDEGEQIFNEKQRK